jgi:hypothetical protein
LEARRRAQGDGCQWQHTEIDGRVGHGRLVVSLVMVTMIAVLCPTDDWHHQKGYACGNNGGAFVFHVILLR